MASLFRPLLRPALSLQLLGSFDAIDDGKDESKNVATALRLLPLMIGWFSLSVPSGLGLYWVFNNVLTTISTVTVKKLVEKPPIDPKVDLIALGPRRVVRLAAFSPPTLTTAADGATSSAHAQVSHEIVGQSYRRSRPAAAPSERARPREAASAGVSRACIAASTW